MLQSDRKEDERWLFPPSYCLLIRSKQVPLSMLSALDPVRASEFSLSSVQRFKSKFLLVSYNSTSH